MFLKYVSFNIFSMLGLSLYVLADTFFIANAVGSDGLVALNLVLPVYSLLNGIGLLLGIGGSTRYSISMGEGKQNAGSRIFTQTLLVGLVVGLLFTIVGVFFSSTVVRMMGATGTIVPMAEEYLKVMLSFSLAFLANNILVSFIRNDGNPQLSMWAMLIGSMSNIGMDYVLMYPLRMGMAGAALATGASPIISLCILSFYFMKRKNGFRLERGSWGSRELKQIILAGIPAFITEFSSGIVILVFNWKILSLLGNTGVAAYGIISNIALVCVALFTGIGQGIQPIASFHYGAGKRKVVRRIYLWGILLAVLLGLLFYLVGLFLPQTIISLFNRDSDAALAGIATDGIRLYFIAFLMMGINIVSSALFACVELPKQAFLISALRGFGLVLPIILLLPYLADITGVWLTIPIAEFLTMFVSVTIALKRFRRKA